MNQQSSQNTGKPVAEIEKKRERAALMAIVEKMCADSFGVKDGKVALQVLTQAASLQSGNSSELGVDHFNRALSTLREIGPKVLWR